MMLDVRNQILIGDVREQIRRLPDRCVHCVVTSPPYWGLRDYETDGQLGLEPNVDCLGWATGDRCGACYVCRITEVFREVRRVLRDDGTAWVNLGDSYATGAGKVGNCPGGGRQGKDWKGAKTALNRMPQKGLKAKDLVGGPWRVALALQADGWWLRQDIIWHKPNPMPESVTDRCTKSHEYLFLLSKSNRYYYDEVSASEGSVGAVAGNKSNKGTTEYLRGNNRHRTAAGLVDASGRRYAKRNRRTVWTIPTKPYRDAHFATFPPALVLPCLLAGTSEHGVCDSCGAPWRRVVEKVDTGRTQKMPDSFATHEGGHGSFHRDGREKGETGVPVMELVTTGWRAGCECSAGLSRPLVLDPFMGSGTVAEVARECGCDWVGCEINEQYAALARRRLRQGVFL